MNSSELTQEIEKRLKWELVLKSNTAAPVVVILGLGIAYFRFGVAYYADALSILAILCAFNAVVRFFIGRWGIQKKMDHQLVVKFVFYSMALNGFLWAVIFLIVFLQSPVTGLSYALAFMISITLMVASVVTLSYSRVLATCFQMGLLSGNVIVFAREYFVQNNNDYLWMLISLILLAFYFLRQTWDFHRQMFEKYRYEMELELSVKQLQESNLLLIEETARAENSSRLAALGDMAGGMAHEINTPLAIINLMAEETLGLVGSEGPVAGEMRTKLYSVLSAANRISRIIKSLLQISRRGEDTDRIVDLKIEDLFKDVLNIYREKFALAGIELEIAELPDVSVRTKQVLISQVLLNLMNNAFDQITQNESSRNYLRIFFSRSDKKITICLENSGPKISDSVQEKIFQPFFTTKEVGKGTGLGLSICKGIIESLKERIWLDKDASKTTFCFTLPIVESASQAQ